MERRHDVTLFGATGFTGALTAEYLARHAPEGFRLALAGRNRAKLEAVRGKLAAIHPRWAEMPLLHAEIGDAASLAEVAATSRVVATTVGPYLTYGEPLVAACAEHGTAYADLTGEPEFVDRMYLRYDGLARETGARLVHACGFDSIPYDLGALYTVQKLPRDAEIELKGYVRAGATFSGGTFASAITVFSRLFEMTQIAKQRARAEERPTGRRARTVVGTPHRDAESGRWAVPMTTIDPQIVARSAAELDEYGPDFTYRQFMSVKRLPTVVAGAVGLGAVFALAQLPPARKALIKLVGPGGGPDEEKRARSWFKVRFHGSGGGRRVVTEVAGGDPGYDETAKMLGESAMCLALDDLPAVSGQLTTAVAMGDALVKRLVDAGIVFRVVRN
ncbi:trans-acting enoyl reductase family protein [Amycolatopsis sp. 195334CR]|uniref:saccharopine dehydrogenase family protein n=1 Tax=Amycolatopsis sp. 195334CR TaxID=2814588 RepID=UPI001A90A1A7|nr:saccharopine dehydrogenase NADP-binding domain-containing protein [Amycolatopsis sp. 195334CR]MBN6037177.1 saccharopine dehydrogenase NADP-binding domain-containing protein [Amycolatopsis sp. 195334CR]